MFYPTVTKPQGWRAIEYGTKKLLYLGRSRMQVVLAVGDSAIIEYWCHDSEKWIEYKNKG